MKKYTSVTIGLITLILLFNNLNSQTISIPISELSKNIKKYSYTHNISSTEKKEIRYIVLLSSNNEPKTCFDACDVCYKGDKGYSQKTNVLRCNYCGQSFAIDSLGISQVPGTCNPGLLPHNVIDGNVIIKVEDLIKGDYYFKSIIINDIGDEHKHTYNYAVFADYIGLYFDEPAQRKINIYDLNGNIVSSTTYGSNQAVIHTNNLLNGVYILSIECNSVVSNQIFYNTGK